ncbi:Neuropeptide FF receptor 2 [Trichoplax sp. H2]|nr:Neuropeptide FF receptor 2 [Trichoplax sp. H2]|eukprot:RDD40260.1 Neuropeptide FF receptor 2 [Trichoplax sp. H2]
MTTPSNEVNMAPTNDGLRLVLSFVQSMSLLQFSFSKILMPILIIAIINNSLLVLVVIREKAFHKSTYYLLCNQALANAICLTCVFIFSSTLTVSAAPSNSIPNNITQSQSASSISNYSNCTLSSIIYHGSYTVSVLSLAFIALDRYRVVTQSNAKNYDIKAILVTNVLIWLVGWVNGYFFSNFIDHNVLSLTVCDLKFDSPQLAQAYFTINFILTYLLPTIVIVTSYILIIRYLKREHSQIKSIAKIKRKRRNRVIKMSMVITFFFLIPASPWAIFSLIISFLQINFSDIVNYNNTTVIILAPLFQLFYLLTCIVTPALIASYNKAIKSAFVLIYFFYLPKKWRETIINFKIPSCIIFHPFNRGHP